METSESKSPTPSTTTTTKKLMELQLILHQLIKQQESKNEGSEGMKTNRKNCTNQADSWIENEIFRLTTILKMFGHSLACFATEDREEDSSASDEAIIPNVDTLSPHIRKCGAINSRTQFHFDFEQLPNELKIPILEHLNNPQDKLNMMEALPSSEVLMGWNRTLIQFEIIFPMISSYQIAGEWRNLLNLSQADPCLEAIILKHLEQSFDEPKCFQKVIFPTHQFHHITLDSYGRDCLKTIAQKCGPSTKALPFGVYFPIREVFPPVLTTFLENCGGKLWNAWFDLEINGIPGIILTKLIECLRMTQNLRSLELQEWKGYQAQETQLINDNETLMPPELPQLRYLNLFGDCAQILKWILPKYARQLKALHLYHCHLGDEYVASCFPNLEQLSISTIHDFDESYDPDIEKVEFQLSSKFGLSPLKIIYVTLDKADDNKWSRFLLSLKAFKGTLEVLETKFGNCNNFVTGYDMRLVILHLNLPKLNTLHLGMYTGSCDFLVALPSLTRLSISRSNNCTFEEDGLFIFHQEKDTMMREPQVWKLLPVLKLLRIEFEIYRKHPWGEWYKSGKEAYKIIRSDYVRATKQNHFL